MAIIESFLRANEWIEEGSSWYYTSILKDEKGVALPSTALTTLTLTLYDLMNATLAIVNSVDKINILNTGRGLVDANGKLDLTLLPADTGILVASRLYERRRILLEYTYASGVKRQRREVNIIVKNLDKVP